MICRLAANPRRASSGDAELLKLAEEYITAEQRYCDLNLKVDRMEGAKYPYRNEPIPEVLRWRESDAELGLPSLHPFPKDHPLIWDRPIDVNDLRSEKWLFTSQTGKDDELVTATRAIVPSAAARARADEILAAYDERHKEGKPPRGYKKALREKDKAERAYMRIEEKIAETQAATLEGMLAKVRCALAYAKSDEIDDIEGGSCAEVMAISIFHDIQQLAKTA